MSNIIHKILPNGMEVYLHPTNFAPVVSLQVLVKVGSIDEEDDEGGMAHVLEHMLFKGTQKFSQIGQVASMVEAAGGDINAYTTLDHTNYYLTAPSSFTQKGTEILLDVVQNSLLDPIELKKELEVVIEEIKRGRDNPNSIVSYSLFSQAFKGTRLERPVIGYQKIVEAFKRNKIMQFYKKWYAPNNMIFIAAGDFDAHTLLDYIQNFSSNFAFQELPMRVRLNKTEIEKCIQNKKTTIEIMAGDWQEARAQFAVMAPALEHPDMPVWDVLSSILGENDSSRLVRTVRNELGLVTGIDASCYTPKYPFGIFSIGFYGPAKHTLATLQAIISEIEAIAEVKPTQAEILRVTNALKASRIYDQESVDGLTRNASLQLLTPQKMEFEKEYLHSVSTVTGEEIQKVAKIILKQIEDGSVSLACAIDKNSKHTFSKKDLLKAIKVPTHIFEKSIEHSKKIAKSTITSSLQEDVQQIQIKLPQNKTLKINFRKSNRLALTSGMIVFRGGLISEPEGRNGVGALTSTMLTHGTQRQTYHHFVDELEDYAASISAFSGREMFGLRFDSLSDQSLRVLQMMLDCLLRPEFSAPEWSRCKKETMETIVLQKDNPVAQLSRIVQPLLYPDHAYGYLSLGTEDSVSKIHLDDVKEFWQNLFHADEYIFSIAGDFALESIVRLLETELSVFFTENTFKPSKVPKIQQARLPKHKDTRSAFFELNREQCHLMLCFRGCDIKDERRTALEVAANILAGQGGRLFLDLRDQKSLAYSLNASQSPHEHGGAFTTYIACATHKVKESFEGLKKHLENLAKIPPTQEEVDRARQSLLGARSIESQHISYQASQLGMSDAYGLGFDHFLKFEKRLQKVKPKDVSNVLYDLLKNNPPILAAVGARGIWFPDNESILNWS